MNKLAARTEVQTMSSREIATLTNKEHRNVLRDIRDMLNEIGQLNFEPTYYTDSCNRKQLEYNLNRELTDTLLTGYSIPLRHAVIKRWHELEQKQTSLAPTNMIEALTLALEQAKKIEVLQIENNIMQPKADFYDTVMGSDTVCDMATVAKTLNIGIGRNNLLELLRVKGILQCNNAPYQSQVDRGRFKVIESKFTKPNGDVCINFKTVVTQKGLDFIRKILEVKNEKNN